MGVAPGYWRSDIGVLPDDWEVKTLGELGESFIGLTYKPSNVKPDGLLVLRASNVQDGRLRFDDNVYVDVEVPTKLRTRKGDILICVRNGSRPLIGKSALIDETSEGLTFGAFMAVLRTPSSKFVFHQFQSELMTRQIHAHLGATINQITNRSLDSFRVPYPTSDAEREAISEALSDADAMIHALDKLIDKKRDLKQATMQQLLTGRTRLPGFSGEWETRRFGDMFSFIPTANNPRAHLGDTGEVGYVHYGDIHALTSATLDCEAVAIPRISRERVKTIPRVEEGDLIMVDASEDYDGIGKWVEVCNVSTLKVVGGLHTFVLRGKQDVLADGFKAYLQYMPAVRAALIRGATGISVFGVSKSIVASIEVAIPEKEEQSAITTALRDMDLETTALAARRDKARAIKRGMVQELLTGRTRLM